MPRLPRLFAPGYCFHVISRGVNRQATFFSEEDYDLFLGVLSAAAVRYGCRVHAYVLMTNHVHLLVTPETPRTLPRLFQALGRGYVQAINRKYERIGTLWQGRHKTCLVDTRRYALTCYRYVELNPVRAGIVSGPADYRYSSYRHNALGGIDPLVTPHPVYLELGHDRNTRMAAYRQLFAQVIDQRDLSAIRRATDACHVLGSQSFQKRIEAELGRSVGRRKRGRPRLAMRRVSGKGKKGKKGV